MVEHQFKMAATTLFFLAFLESLSKIPFCKRIACEGGIIVQKDCTRGWHNLVIIEIHGMFAGGAIILHPLGTLYPVAWTYERKD